MIIRKANKQDAGRIAIIGNSVWVDSYVLDGIDRIVEDYLTTQFSLENVINIIENHTVYVFEINGATIGYVVVKQENGKSEIDNFYILPGLQGSGYGKQILAHLRQLHSNLWLRCWHKNERALQFYYKNGFTKIGESYFELGEERHRNEILESI